MADLPADLRLRRTLIERIASALEARMQRQEPTRCAGPRKCPACRDLTRARRLASVTRILVDSLL